MTLSGKLIKGTIIIKEAVAERNDAGKSFRDLLEECFVELCGKLDVQVPLWLEKNTREFARFRRTFFSSEQFFEKVPFDRFEIRLQ